MLDELGAAEAFLQVVRAQGYSRAAKVLGKSVSTLSRVVTELEAHLGTQLIARTTRRMHLTEAGALYMRHAEALVAASRAAHDAMTELVGGAPRGRLRVSMPVSVGERLGPHLSAFHRRYPELRLEVDLSDRNVSLIEGGFDLAIRVGRPADSTLRGQLLGRVSVLLVASPAYLEAHGEPRRPADIAAHSCLTLGPEPGPAEWVFWKGQKRESVAVEGMVHTASPVLAAQLAKSGLGLMRTVEWVIRDDLMRGELQPVMRTWSCNHPRRGGVPVFVLYAQNASVAPPLKSRVFVDMMKAVVAQEIAARP